MKPPSDRYVAAGLFLATLATLLLEMLDSRLLSVLTWYHLAFLAVSVAMLGMASGAVLVFLGGERFEGGAAARNLARACTWFALAIPVSHVASLCMPIPLLEQFTVMEVAAVALSTVILGVPFLLSGVVITLGLTRTGGSIGKLYAADLLGAALGCLLFIPLLSASNISSVAFVAAAAAAGAAWAFHRFAHTGKEWYSLTLAVVLLAAAVANATTQRGVGVVFAKGRDLRPGSVVEWSGWNTHSYVSISRAARGPVFYWGKGRGAGQVDATVAWILIDGEAGTPITQWNGDRGALDWVQFDVTAVPYHLRRGDAGIIGVGGGRDVLSAIWGRSTSITGIEINNHLLRALEGPYRRFAGIVDQRDVTLVPGEARSYLSRTDRRFDILQMSLIDTWAATGAGAFTLSENGLYTVEGWRVFLNTLKPGGVFSVSRWFAPQATSETSRLIALGVAALLDRGVRRPAEHIVMLARGSVATLLVSNQPFTPEDRQRVTRLAETQAFTLLVSPWTAPADGRLGAIVGSGTRAQLDAAVQHPMFDYSPPTDERPFFFNTLKLGSFYKVYDIPRGGAIWGNLRATFTLVLLLLIAAVLVAAVIVWPLLRSGLPSMDAESFALSVAYFALIGAGYMLIQIPFLQRFSVYLGHPTYSFTVILFSMIFFTGIGSFLSDRLPIDRDRWLLGVPILIGLCACAMTVVIQLLIDSTIQLGLPARSLAVVACTAPLSVLLGFCFPVGMTLVGRLSTDATAWMWGVNGACGVLASIVAVCLSMWMGIDTNLLIAGCLYLVLPLVAQRLARKVSRRPVAPTLAVAADARIVC